MLPLLEGTCPEDGRMESNIQGDRGNAGVEDGMKEGCEVENISQEEATGGNQRTGDAEDTNRNNSNSADMTIAAEMDPNMFHDFRLQKVRIESMKRKSAELKENSNVGNSSSQKKHVMDQGWAWVVLFGGVLNHILGDGILLAVGVLLVTWQDQFPGSVSQLSWIISLSLGVAYITGPFGSALCKKFSIRQVVMAGTILASISLAAASQATSLWHLYVTFGLAGLGLSLTIQPGNVICTYYFEKYLARANGIAYTGAGGGMFILSPLFQYLIDEFGWQGALLLSAGIVSNMGICAAIFRPTPSEVENRSLSSRSKNSEQEREDGPACCSSCLHGLRDFLATILESFDFKLLKDVYFTLLLIACSLFGVGYVIIILYLPSRAVDAGHHNVLAAFLVSVVGISSIVSRILHGYIIDYKLMSAAGLTAIAYFVCGASCVLNPLIDDYVGLVILSVFVGLSTGVYASTVPILAKEYVGIQRVSGGVGLIHLNMGAGFILGSYVAGILFDATNSYDIPFHVSGIGFFVCSGLIFARTLSKHIRQRHRQRRQTQEQEKGQRTRKVVVFSITRSGSPDAPVGHINVAIENEMYKNTC